MGCFGSLEILDTGLSRWEQIGVQVFGTAALLGFSFAASYALFRLLNHWSPMRVDEQDEMIGLNLSEHGASSNVQELIDEMQRHKEVGDFSQPVAVETGSDVAPIAEQYNEVLKRVQLENAKSELSLASAQLAQLQSAESEKKQRQQASSLEKMNGELNEEMQRRQEVEVEIQDLNHQLLTSSKQAALAEFSSGVLHNIGNAINSVNVSAAFVEDEMRHSKVENLSKLIGLLQEHEDDLFDFLTNDERGKKVPLFLQKTAACLESEKDLVISEVQNLLSCVDHIRQMISSQQTAAKQQRSISCFSGQDLLDQAVQVTGAGIHAGEIELVQTLDDVPEIQSDKHCLLQVLINFITNAQQALQESDVAHPKIDVKMICVGEADVRIDVMDNGVGITPDNLKQIFQHGFTTKETGHGFGLHSCQTIAEQLGGQCTVSSAGPGKGATFSIEFPKVFGLVPSP